MRLIDADKAIEEYTETRQKLVEIDAELFIEEIDELDYVIRQLKLQPTVEQGWIPCSERMPDVQEFVAVTVKIEHFPRITSVAIYLPIHQRWLGYNDEDILAWQPLPQPYKESEVSV